MTQTLKAPFPWFGGKSRIAGEVWARLGNVANYVEPFFGSGAVLLARPHAPGTETVNDLDCYLANFWRAVKLHSGELAELADYPVSEVDLTARHGWLVRQTEFRTRMLADPEYYDVRVAAWWVWGLSSWIGDGWCAAAGNERHGANAKPENWRVRPNIKASGGVQSKLPHLSHGEKGVYQKRPQLSQSAKGVVQQIPSISKAGNGITSKRPMLSDDGVGVIARRRAGLAAWFEALAERLRETRVACGDWRRVLTPAVTTHCRSTEKLTGVFLDPPYASADLGMRYSGGHEVTADNVREWALAHGDNPMFRIALCGYDGEHVMPGWECLPWKAAGGYGSGRGGRGEKNSRRERIWFSSHCLKPDLLTWRE